MKMKIDLKLFIEIFITGLLTLSLVFWYSGFLTSSARLAQASGSLEEHIFIEVNEVRKKNNLSELKNDPLLKNAAKNKTLDMINNQYFAHVSPSDKKWSDFIKDEGYNYLFAGENLAKDYDNPKEIISAWIESPTHKENILNAEYVDTGVAVTFNRTSVGSGVLIAQEFGKKL
jgi:uncharacterized protein YkwD